MYSFLRLAKQKGQRHTACVLANDVDVYARSGQAGGIDGVREHERRSQKPGLCSVSFSYGGDSA